MAFLKGYRLLDMAWLGPGSFCSQILGDLGFDVIKITEVARGAGRRGGQEMTTPMWFHEPVPEVKSFGQRNARSITLDLKTDEGRDVFRRLVERADALQEGFRPGVAARLGVDYESVCKYRPDIVYASLTGYGQTGPYRDRVAHDLSALAVSGFLDMNGRAGGPPAIPATLVSDYAGAMSAAIHILAALLAREHTGQGAYADVSLADASFEFNSLPTIGYLASGLEPRRGETFTSGFWPWSEVYETGDGGYISIVAVEPWFWGKLCEIVGLEEFTQAQWSIERRSEMRQAFREMFKSRTRDEWAALFEGVDVCFAPVNSIAQAVDDPQMRERGMVVEVEHPVYGKTLQVGSMLKLNGQRVEARRWLMKPGQDTDEVLEEHGYSRSEIEELRHRSVVG